MHPKCGPHPEYGPYPKCGPPTAVRSTALGMCIEAISGYALNLG